MVVGLGAGVVLRGRFGGSFEMFNIQRTYNIIQHAYNTHTTYVQHTQFLWFLLYFVRSHSKWCPASLRWKESLLHTFKTRLFEQTMFRFILSYVCTPLTPNFNVDCELHFRFSGDVDLASPPAGRKNIA